MALSVPSRSVTSYKDKLLSPDPVLTVTDVPAMLALTSGSTIMLTPDVNGVVEWPVASDRVVL